MITVNERISKIELICFMRKFTGKTFDLVESKIIVELWRTYAYAYLNDLEYLVDFSKYVGKFVSGEWVIVDGKAVFPMSPVNSEDIYKVVE